MNTYYLATAATQETPISPLAYKMLSCLQGFAGRETRTCWPKYKTLAARCGCSKRSAMRAVQELCAAGLLKKRAQFERRRNAKGYRQKENMYTLIDCPQMTLQEAAHAPKRNGNEKYRQTQKHARQGLYRAHVVDLSGLSGNAIKVYNYITRRAGSEGSCFVPKKEIAVGCGISVATVYRTVKELSAAGLLQVTTQTRRVIDGSNATACNRYIVRAPKATRITRAAMLKLLVVCMLASASFTPHITGFVTGGYVKSVTPGTATRKNNLTEENKGCAYTLRKAVVLRSFPERGWNERKERFASPSCPAVPPGRKFLFHWCLFVNRMGGGLYRPHTGYTGRKRMKIRRVQI